MSVATVTCQLVGTIEGVIGTNWASVELAQPLRRSVGLAGDSLRVLIAAEDLAEAGWDPAAEYRVRISDGTTTITFGGYYLLRREPAVWSLADDPDNDPPEVRVYGLTLLTLPGLMRDGRGALIRAQTFNPLGPDGFVDAASPDFRTNAQLAQLALSATAMAAAPVPFTMDLAPDGTVLDPPGPIDWGNARAIPELEAICARVGYAASFSNGGDGIYVHPLRRAGQSVALPSGLVPYAEPYELTPARAVRGNRILVTSGRTRSAVVSRRNLDDLEWVGFDHRTGAWLNATEWAAAYPSETVPGDVTTFRLGPKGAEGARGLSRCFTALRLTGEDRERCSRFVRLGVEALADDEATALAGVEAVAIVAGCEDTGNGVFLNLAEPKTLDGVRVVPGEGVFVLPTEILAVKMDPGPLGSWGEAAELEGDELQVVFLHEADADPEEDGREVNYYQAAFGLDANGDVYQITDEGDVAAMAIDPMAIKVEMPALRLLLREESDGSYTRLNGDELDAVAKRIAAARLSANEAQSGRVVLAGFHEVAPGDAFGAISSIEWDPTTATTTLELNAHEIPQAWWDRQAAAARHSLAAGISRYSLAGSSAALGDVRGGSTPGDLAGLEGGSLPETAGGSRGRDRAAAGGRSAELAPRPGQGAPLRRDLSRVWGQITDSTSLGDNRWLYEWVQVVPDGQGFREVANGLSGTALNTIETPNTSSVTGSGIDPGNLPDGFAMVPVAAGAVVELVGPHAYVDDEETVEVWHFQATTLADGSCA